MIRLRRRLDGIREQDDAGFMLIWVLAVTTVIVTVVASALVVAGNALIPAVQSSYNQSAAAAAQSGLQAFIAYADANCGAGDASVTTCTLPTNYSGVVSIPTQSAPSGYTATYTWTAVKDPGNRYFRVRSTGVVSQGSLSSTKVLVGDVVGGASLDLLDYGVVTGFESESSSTVLAQWPARTIALTCAGISGTDYPIKGDKCSSNPNFLNSIRWSGSSPGSAPGKVAVCNATFEANGGRSNTTPNGAPNPYVDWTESGLAGNNYTNYQPCQTSWGNGTRFLAPANPADGAGGYFTNDALLLSNSYPGGSGPQIDQPIKSLWRYTAADAGLCGTVPGQNYRSFNLLCAGYPVEVGGTPASTSLYPNVNWVSQGPQLPTDQPVIPTTACVYAGPTRVSLNGGTAIVTSPQTTAAWIAANAATRPQQCYVGANAAGMAAQTISLTSPVAVSVVQAVNNGSVPKTTPAIAHGSSGWPTTGQRLGDTASTSNSVFYLTNGTSGTSSTTAWTDTATPGGYTPANADLVSTKSDGAWKPQWTLYTTGSCTGFGTATNLRFAGCYMPIGTAPDAYTWLKTQVQAAIAANPSAYTTAAAVQTLVNGFVAQGNSADAANATPTNGDYTSHRWQSTVSSSSANGCTTSTGVAGTATDTPVSAPTTDTFFTNTAGNSHAAPSTDTSCFTVSVTAQVGQSILGIKSWGDGGLLGIPLAAGSSVPQFQVTVTAKKTTTTTTTTAATSTFPSMSDVTQYQLGNNGTYGASGPGDLYVDGTVNATTALVAANDLVATGSVGPANPATAAVELVGENDVRVYHPVKCKITDATAIATTDAGWCPDDITGLYNTVPPSGQTPYEQYVNLRPDLTGLTLRAVVFALGNSDAHITCPQPPGGNGVCGGDLTVDNYNRGTSLGRLTDIGTLGMAHHAPVGQEWEINDTTGQSGRAWSGYQLTQQYQNVKALVDGNSDVKNLLKTRALTSSLWRILSISTGTSS